VPDIRKKITGSAALRSLAGAWLALGDGSEKGNRMRRPRNSRFLSYANKETRNFFSLTVASL
jgi:hypothetical protein